MRSLYRIWLPSAAGDQPAQAPTQAEPDLISGKPAASDSPKQAAEKLVWSFLVLFESLVSARTLMKSLQEASLLIAPLPGQPAVEKGQEVATAEGFMKKLQVGLHTKLLYHSVSSTSNNAYRLTAAFD